MMEFEKEITGLLKKMESRKERGVKVLRGSSKSSYSHLEREFESLNV